jgi:SAM-dependent methyltransferase
MKNLILDLGCGKSKYPGAIGIDSNKKSDADFVFDIERGIPFPTNQFDQVISSHTLEHIEPKKLVFVLEEIWRVTKPQGKITISGPHFTGASAAANPTHLRQGFSSQLFCYFISENEYPNYGKISFKVNKILLRKGRTRNPLVNLVWASVEILANLNPLVCELTWAYWFGGFFEIEFQLQPIK